MIRSNFSALRKLAVAAVVAACCCSCCSSSSIVKWRMATSEKVKNGNGEVTENTQWHQLIAWGNLANVVEKYVVKGTRLAIEGRLNHRKYVAKDGQNKEATEIVVKDIMFVGSKKEKKTIEANDEIPF